jgi:predicted branched-subunit amino acid permease
MSSKRKEFLSGVRAVIPILFGVIPFGMIYGVLALDAGMSPAESQAMSSIVFAGSSQFIATQLIGNAVLGVVIVLTIGIINLRHLLYSASISPYFVDLSRPWKAFLAYFLTDEAYAVAISHFRNLDRSEKEIIQGEKNHEDLTSRIRYKHWYYLGAGFGLWSTWQISTAAGIYMGAIIPENWSLDFTLSLTLIALVVPTLEDRASLLSAITAGLIAVLAFSLPYKLGLLAAALCGILIGVLIRKKS